MRREVQILHHLGGHPNITLLKGAFEDKYNVHLVMELCSGGELFDRIVSRGHYRCRAATVRQATVIPSQLQAGSMWRLLGLAALHPPVMACYLEWHHYVGTYLSCNQATAGCAHGGFLLLCSEKDAATMCRTIVKVVGHCHSLGVMHRRVAMASRVQPLHCSHNSSLSQCATG